MECLNNLIDEIFYTSFIFVVIFLLHNNLESNNNCYFKKKFYNNKKEPLWRYFFVNKFLIGRIKNGERKIIKIIISETAFFVFLKGLIIFE